MDGVDILTGPSVFFSSSCCLLPLGLWLGLLVSRGIACGGLSSTMGVLGGSLGLLRNGVMSVTDIVFVKDSDFCLLFFRICQPYLSSIPCLSARLPASLVPAL